MSFSNFVASFLMAVFLVAGLASANAAPDFASEQHRFDVAATEARAAIREFAAQAKVQIMVAGENVDRAKLNPVTGDFSTEEGLRILLAQSGLQARYVGERSIALVREGEETTRALAGDSFRVAQAETGAAAQSAGSVDETGLEEIVVTAQRRAERLQDVPISISVLSGEDLDRSSVRAVSDALNQIGGVSLLGTQPGEMSVSIRGVVPAAGTSTTGYYLDEVPFAFIGGLGGAVLPDANAFDLARVEVLRGPQGTLYGVNALGGVVRVLSNDANPNEFEAKGRARVSHTEQGSGDYGGDLAINVPLIPGKLAIRGVAGYSNLSGFIDSSTTGERQINDTRAQAYRLKARYEPNDRASVSLGATRSRIDNGAPSQAFDNLTTPLSGDQPDERIYDAYNLIAEYDWSSASLLSSTSYLDYDTDTRVGSAGLQYFQHLDGRIFAQEFRLSSRLQGPWQWSAGTFYKDTTNEDLQDARPIFGVSAAVNSTSSESYAVFGELTRSFAEGRFELTGGLRYFNDRIKRASVSNFFGTAVPPPQSADFDPTTGRIVLAYKPQPNKMFYVSAATGFRNGLPRDGLIASIDPRFPALDPDELLTYEVGSKGRVLGGAITYDASVYYTVWTDIQQAISLLFGNRSFGVAVNGDDASGTGVDASVAYQPTSALSLHASAGWNDLKFEKDVISNSVVLFAKDSRLNTSPEWTGSAGVTYRIATPITGTHAVLSSSYTYRSGLLFRRLAGTNLQTVEADYLRTLSASIGLESERWSAEIFGDNLLDDRNAIMPPDPFRFGISGRQRPRMIGLQTTFRY
jgi:iron complex outermembrane recepter protein